MHPRSTALDPTLHSPEVLDIKRKLLDRTRGQDHAVDVLARILETFFAGYNDPRKPVGVVLELGPTGTGKTSLIENPCEILYGNPNAHVRVNCADFSDNHQVNRMIGAPPGYTGYNDKKADHYFTQAQLDEHQVSQSWGTKKLLARARLAGSSPSAATGPTTRPFACAAAARSATPSVPSARRGLAFYSRDPTRALWHRADSALAQF